MERRSFLGLWLVLSVLPAQAEIIGNGFIGLTSDLGARVNTAEFEWSPRISADGLTLVFCSCRPDCSLFLATRPDRSSRFDWVEEVGPPIDSLSTNEYTGLLSKDGKTFIFTRGDGGHSLLVSTRSEPSDPFGTPVPLELGPGLTYSYAAGPSLSSDELALFFSAKGVGGKGGEDIWVSLRDTTEDPLAFGTPIPLEEYAPGSMANTAFDDSHPTITADELTLIFSDSWDSIHPGGKGRNDIWVSRRSSTDEPFGEPINLNDVSLTPVNTGSSELSASVTPDWPLRGAQIFFISERGGPQDIWQATWEAIPEAAFSASPLSGQAPVTVTFDAAGSSTPAGTEPLSFAWDFGDGTSGEGAVVTHTFVETGRLAVSLTATNSVGVSGSVTQGVTVSCPSGDVSPWTSADVGLPLFPGSAAKDGDEILVCAGGYAVSVSADQLHFVHREVAGDFAAVLRISDVTSWEMGAAVGLTVRETLKSSSRNVALLLLRRSTGIQQRLRSRLEEGATTDNEILGWTEIPSWLRLERSGDLIVALVSSHENGWEEVARQTIPGLPATVLCGVAACGADSNDPAKPFTPLRARLSGLEIIVPEVEFQRADPNADGKIDISDAVFVLMHLFLGGPRPTCGKAADANDDGSVDISDPVYLLGYLFLGGSAPNTPLRACGFDPTPDELTCESFAMCP